MELVYPKNDWNHIFLKNNIILQEIKNNINYDKIIFPDENNIFKAFKLCSFEKTKVIIIGQDCYHGDNQANGLCFSVNSDIKQPPSLKNILKEMKADSFIRTNSDFSDLAKQGVLFLNTALTVEKSCPGSHIKIWEPFTDNIIKELSDNKNKLIFILWGNFAKKKKKIIDTEKHIIIEGNHPSPLSANRGGFFNKNYFSLANSYLDKKINWGD